MYFGSGVCYKGFAKAVLKSPPTGKVAQAVGAEHHSLLA
jgi:hypothetical protein